MGPKTRPVDHHPRSADQGVVARPGRPTRGPSAAQGPGWPTQDPGRPTQEPGRPTSPRSPDFGSPPGSSPDLATTPILTCMQRNTKHVKCNRWIKYPMHPRVERTSYKGSVTSTIRGKEHAANQEATRPYPKVGRPGTDLVLHVLQPPQLPTDVWSAS